MILTGFNDNDIFSNIDECPECGKVSAKVVDSRLDETLSIRIRRKECKSCGRRWNTVEITEADFENIGDLKEARDILTLKDAAKQMEEQLSQLKIVMLNLSNASLAIENTTIKKNQAYNNRLKLYADLK